MKMDAIQFHVERVNEPQIGITHLIVWPDATPRYTQHSHPDRSILEVEAGDIVIYRRRTQYRVLRMRPYRSDECKSEENYPWTSSLRDYR